MFNDKDILNRYDLLINSVMQKKHGKKTTPVRQEIQERHAPWPQKLENFIAHAQKKEDFLAQQLVLQVPPNKELPSSSAVSAMNMYTVLNAWCQPPLCLRPSTKKQTLEFDPTVSRAKHLLSVFLGHTKKSCWKIFTEHPWQTWSQWLCLCGFFICKIKPDSRVSVDSTRSTLFIQAHPLETFWTMHNVLSHQAGTLPSNSMARGRQAASCNTATRDYGMENWEWCSSLHGNSLPAMPESCAKLIMGSCTT